MRSHARGVCCVVAVLLGFGLAQSAFAEDAAAIADRLHRVDAATALDGAGVVPWHLKMSVQLFDAKGQPGEQGLIEEWWSGAQMDRVVYALPSYKATELQRGGEFYRSKSAEQPPLMLELLREQVVHPMPQPRDVEGTLAEFRRERFGKASSIASCSTVRSKPRLTSQSACSRLIAWMRMEDRCGQRMTMDRS